MPRKGPVGRALLRLLLTSSSVVALLIGGGAPAAFAAACTNIVTGGYDNPAGPPVTNICVKNTTFIGSISNEGTISPSGIAFVNATSSGRIVSTGTIVGGISVDGGSEIASTTDAIEMIGPSFAGGISNAGTVSGGSGYIAIVAYGGSIFGGGISNSGTVSGGNAISVTNVTDFSGGIANSSALFSSFTGIAVDGNSTFTGNINNSASGTISPGSRDGIVVENNSIFSGSISNAGTISASHGDGIYVDDNASFSGGITNSGQISASGTTAGAGVGIDVGGNMIFSGGITNASSGTISGSVDGIFVDASSFGGSITNAGTIVGGIAVYYASTFSGGITNSGTISNIFVDGVEQFGSLGTGGITNTGTVGPITVGATSFTGGISNSGTISGSGLFAAIGIGTGGSTVVSFFSGGITNSGTITAPGLGGLFGDGIVENAAHFTGNIINAASGTIAATSVGVFVLSSTFTGNVSNAGVINSSGGGFSSGVGIDVAGVTSYSGGITNSGTIMAGIGIDIISSTINGAIIDSGVINASSRGILIDNASKVASTTNAIKITGPSFTGGISNAGTLSASAGGAGIEVLSVTAFSGGIANSGTISASAPGGFTSNGISVSGVSTFSGGISNSGTISADGIGILAEKATFSGGISNSGTILAALAGINVAVVSAFSGGISNAGAISAGATGIDVDITVPTFSGGISNSGTISAGNFGISVLDVSTFSGGISNAGAISAGIPGGFAISGIAVGSDSAFSGGINNTGTISAAGIGIDVGGVTAGLGTPPPMSTFSGGISNSGMISAGGYGIEVVNVSVFSGGVSNAGTLSAAGNDGLQVANVSVFSGGIGNSGAISAGVVGINVLLVSGFSGGISNAGTISAGNYGIAVGATFLGGGVSSFSGGISNSGTISGGGYGIYIVGVSAFSNGISNRSAGTISATLTGIIAGTVSSFSGGISNAGTISAGVKGIDVGGIAVGTGAVVPISTFTGGITNSGMISAGGFHGFVIGTGILVGSFISTFSGGITNAGTISAVLGIGVSTLSVFSGSVTNSGTISAANIGILVSAVGNFGGGIANSGLIDPKTGISVSSVSTFSGGITNSGAGTIDASAIAISVSGVSSFSGNISNAGKISAVTGIEIDAGVTFASGGAIVNTGVITGSTAAIDVSNATSPVVIDQNGGTLAGAIKLSSNADVLNVNGGSIEGNIVGAGRQDTLNFAPGSGNSFTYGASYKFTGINRVNVNSGAVILDGAGNSATHVTIAAGAGLQVGDASNTGATLTSTNPLDVFGTLSGHGSVLGDVIVENGGTLLPGGSIGTLTIGGALTLSSGSFYTVEISPTGASKTLANSAALNGATVKVVPDLGLYSATSYTILTTTSTLGATNTFNPTVSVSGTVTLNSPTLIYDSHDAYLSIAASYNTLTLPSGANGTERNIAAAINDYILGGGTVPSDFQALAGLNDGALLTALDQLAGQAGTGFRLGAFQADSLFLNLLLDPFDRGRTGNSGVGPALAYAPEHPQARAAARAFAPFDKAPAHVDRRFGVWAGGYGGSGAVDGDPTTGAVDTTSRVYGYAAGLDYRLTPDSVVGFALGGGGTNWGLDQDLGGGRSDVFQAGVYGSAHLGAAYLAGALGYSWYNVTTNRTVYLGGTTKLEGDFRANALSARLEGGYRFAFVGFGVTPYAAVQTQALYLPSYTETATSGSPSFALSYDSQTATTTRSELGAWLDYTCRFDRGASLKVYSRAAWAHDFNSSATATAFFQSLPGSSFLVNSAEPAADGALVTAGATYKFGNGWSLAGKFDGEFSGNTSLYSGTGIIRKQW